MFTGLIEEVGKVLWVRVGDQGSQLQLAAPVVAPHVETGESVSVNGCCLTVAAHHDDHITFDLLDETLDRTNLRHLRRDSLVNLERALSANGRLGGHFVQGHVDWAAHLLALKPAGQDLRLEVELPSGFQRYLVQKGSIAINGISLTVAEVQPDRFAVWIIPHTRQHTNLDQLQSGDLLNLEFDIIAKYVERLVVMPTP